MRITDPLPLTHASAGEDGQDIVRAVAAKNPVRLHAQQVGRCLPKALGHRVRVQRQAVQGLEYSLAHPGRRRVRVFVRIEFDEPALLRLFAGRVAFDGQDFGSGKAVHGRSLRLEEGRPGRERASRAATPLAVGPLASGPAALRAGPDARRGPPRVAGLPACSRSRCGNA